MSLRFIFLAVALLGATFYASVSAAACDFDTARYIDKLIQPKSISRIYIEVPKSGKYVKNALRILTSTNPDIPPSLRKKFAAKIRVEYKFGTCSYEGTIRQHGDGKDHITWLKEGTFTRSLSVNLDDGNIQGAVAFILFLPRTRNDHNEVIGSIIFQKLGFLAPKTFAVETTVNGVSTSMLFQEKVRKELLERNKRREGPLFEGDEIFLWSYKNFDGDKYKPLLLSRLTNKTWFLKSRSHRRMGVYALDRLQRAYLKFAADIDYRFHVLLYPNEKTNSIFSNFLFLSLAMNASHGLISNNRKYFYNPIHGNFEPIYYDGNIRFDRLILPYGAKNWNEFISRGFTKPVNQNLVTRILTRQWQKEICDEYVLHINEKNIERATAFCNKAVNQFISNAKQLDRLISEQFQADVPEVSAEVAIEKYIDFQKNLGVDQVLVTEIEEYGEKYAIRSFGELLSLVEAEELTNIVSKNRFNGKRHLVFNAEQITKPGEILERSAIIRYRAEGILLYASRGIRTTINEKNKVIELLQSESSDWALIFDSRLHGWTVKFKGTKKADKTIPDNGVDRMNEYGLTGCLTVYESDLENTSFNVTDSDCEDALNIMNSSGSIGLIEVTESSSDAIDLDFSTLDINKVIVSKAGNDCLDVSGGDYTVTQASLELCGDKGVSVGEMSLFHADEVIVKGSEIGISSKDSSKTFADSFKGDEVQVCLEAKKKKQEFFGSVLEITGMTCSGQVVVDQQSILQRHDL